MLFLLNNQVLDVELPERRLAKRWRIMGCGEPHGMRARDAVEFVRRVVDDSRAAGEDIELECAMDLAALIVAKTGANAAQFIPRGNGASDAQLNTFNDVALQIFRDAQSAADLDAQADIPSPWITAVA